MPPQKPDEELTDIDKRGRALIAELLETLRNPDPVRAAERAAYEAQKELEDEASIRAFHERRKAKKAARAAAAEPPIPSAAVQDEPRPPKESESKPAAVLLSAPTKRGKLDRKAKKAARFRVEQAARDARAAAQPPDPAREILGPPRSLKELEDKLFVVSSNPPKRGRFDRRAGDAHREWLLRGRTGDGRLEVVGFDAREMRLDGQSIPGARIEGVKFGRANLYFTNLCNSELIACDFTGAWINSAQFRGATIVRCVFDDVHATLVNFSRALLSECSFMGADHLDRSDWAGAVVSRTSFQGAIFFNTWFHKGQFTECDFREARLQPYEYPARQTLVGAMFEHCDFRDADFTGSDLSGATFRACKFVGAHGTPAATKGVQVIDADFSAAGDGSDIGGVADLLARLGAYAPDIR